MIPSNGIVMIFLRRLALLCSIYSLFIFIQLIPHNLAERVIQKPRGPLKNKTLKGKGNRYAFFHQLWNIKHRRDCKRESLKLKMLSLCGLDGLFATQYDTINDLPDTFFKEKREIKAIVVKVVDGDTYKVRHMANSRSSNFQGTLKDYTITVRIAAVDTPETAKQGNPGQKFANEAKEFAERKLLNKQTRIKLLSRDQYGRVIGLVKYRDSGFLSWFRSDRDISEELLKQGLASVYRQGGAQYDGSVERWNLLEKAAQSRKKGMWENGIDKADLPSNYKKAVKKKSTITRTNDGNQV